MWKKKRVRDGRDRWMMAKWAYAQCAGEHHIPPLGWLGILWSQWMLQRQRDSSPAWWSELSRLKKASQEDMNFLSLEVFIQFGMYWIRTLEGRFSMRFFLGRNFFNFGLFIPARVKKKISLRTSNVYLNNERNFDVFLSVFISLIKDRSKGRP